MRMNERPSSTGRASVAEARDGDFALAHASRIKGRDLRVFCYMSGSTSAEDAGAIPRHQAAIAAVVASLACQVAGLVVDDGPVVPGTCRPALFGLVRAARSRGVDVVVLETVSRFDPDPGRAARIANILCDAGVQLIEAPTRGRALPAGRAGPATGGARGAERG